MQDETDDLLSKAILSVKTKNAPQTHPNAFHVPEDKHKAYYNILEVWGSDVYDTETDNKVKYIYDFLRDRGSVRDQLLKIFTLVGVPRMGETKLDKVYHYLHLMTEAKKARQHHQQLNNEIKSLRRRR